MELSIDTSTRYASVALSRQGEVVMEIAWRSEQNHSVEFVPTLRRLMAQANVKMEKIRAIFVARGPGGFSALRVGMSVAKALAMAQTIPLVAIGTLDIEAKPYLGLGTPLCALIEGGRTKVYAAMYGNQTRANGDPGAEYLVVAHDELVAHVHEPTLFCGEGVRTVAGILRESLGGSALIADAPPPTRRPGVLAQLGYQRLLASDTDDPEALTPFYMRGSQFEIAQRMGPTS